jgi:phenylpyruvate tautomerase PptA (4-oxalocrotonate tautomerase family)
MPIADVEIICAGRIKEQDLARKLANELGRVFSSPPGQTWVRVRTLASENYAENESEIAASELPVFVTLLLAHPPADIALEKHVRAFTAAVARVVDRPERLVHVQYAPAAAGRQAFGGVLVK